MRENNREIRRPLLVIDCQTVWAPRVFRYRKATPEMGMFADVWLRFVKARRV